MISNGKNAIIFGLSNGHMLAAKVAQKAGLHYGNIITTQFADGEILVKSNSTVRGLDVFLFQSTSAPVNDNLMELFIAIDSLKRAAAKSITVIIPYYGYSRQDRKAQGREPITCKLIANFLQKAGAHKIILIDIHSDQTQGFFDIPVDVLNVGCILFNHFKKSYHNFSNLKVVAPDYGAVKKVRKLSEKLNIGLAIVDKRRPAPNMVEVCNVLGDVAGYDCLLYDDIVDTGGTIINNIDILKKNGAKDIFVMISHGVFSKNSLDKFAKLLEQKMIQKFFITDSIQANCQVQIPNFEVVSLADFLTEIIDSEINHKSVSLIYAKYWNLIMTK